MDEVALEILVVSLGPISQLALGATPNIKPVAGFDPSTGKSSKLTFRSLWDDDNESICA